MNDYIKREDAIELINSLPWTSSADQTKKKNLILLFTLYDAADVVPMDFHDRCMEIEIQKRMNMVEVVRCKDCRKREKINGITVCPIAWIKAEVSDDDYCSCGERRTDG